MFSVEPSCPTRREINERRLWSTLESIRILYASNVSETKEHNEERMIEMKKIIEKKLLRDVKRIFDFYDNPPLNFPDHPTPLQGRLFIGDGILLEEQSRRIMYIGPPVGVVRKRWCMLFSDILVFVKPDTEFDVDIRPLRSSRFTMEKVIPLKDCEVVVDEDAISEFSNFELPFSFLLKTRRSEDTLRFGTVNRQNLGKWAKHFRELPRELKEEEAELARVPFVSSYSSELPSSKDQKEDDPKFLRELTYRAAVSGDIDALNKLLWKMSTLKTFLHEYVKDRRSPLHYALAHGSLPMVKSLVEVGKSDVNFKNEAITSPLTAAVSHAESLGSDVFDCIKLLIENNADIDHRSSAPDCGHVILSPLLHSIRTGRYNIAKLLLESGASPTVPDASGRTLLHFIDAKVKDSDTNGSEIINQAIKCGADISTIDHRGTTPTMEAVRQNRIETALELLKCKANVNDTPGTKSGKSLLATAASQGSTQMVALLLSFGANPNQRHSVSRTHDGQCYGDTPLHIAANQSTANMLASHGARLDLRDSCGNLPGSLFNEDDLHISSIQYKELQNEHKSYQKACPQSSWSKRGRHCGLCSERYSFFSRWHHHCRLCGYACCSDCRSKQTLLLFDSDTSKVAGICIPCFNKTLYGVENSVSQYTSFDVGSLTKSDSEEECCVCLDEERNAVFITCGHFKTCFTCAEEMNCCPVCRKEGPCVKVFK